VNGLGPLFKNIWTCGSSPLSGSRNPLRWIKSVSCASRLSKIWKFIGAIQIISCCDWWPWKEPGYITMTQRQRNNQWSGAKTAHLAQRISECKIPLDKVTPPFFGIKKACSSLIIFQRAKLSTLSIIHPFLCNCRIFWEKNSTWISGRKFFLTRKFPGSSNNSKTEETGLPGFQFHDRPPYSPYLASSSYHLLTGLKKLKIVIFRPTRTSFFPGFIVERTKFWIFWVF